MSSQLLTGCESSLALELDQLALRFGGSVLSSIILIMRIIALGETQLSGGPLLPAAHLLSSFYERSASNCADKSSQRPWQLIYLR